MRNINCLVICSVSSLLALLLSSCATNHYQQSETNTKPKMDLASIDYASRIPHTVNTSEKEVIVYPSVHVWGAYDSSGDLLKSGLATSGSNWCPDLGRPCHTKVGTFRVYSLGSVSCKSRIFPIPHGGAPMPYCMYFNNGQALHGSYELGDANLSHGCVRMQVSDAEWLRFNFVDIGTRVIVKPY